MIGTTEEDRSYDELKTISIIFHKRCGHVLQAYYNESSISDKYYVRVSIMKLLTKQMS
ncbi:hypothetical protein [Clostridium hydrogenum]|uniref:hypothetical protein n=1 Tax=Clostridium hydrogenum TaxID=2855764 RepID=UPI001F403A28|nr:hypothetical protein [Clostridium hydrogenum]